MAWTGSGDGIVAVGSGVSMWARSQSSWKLAWRFTPQVPQSLVSTTRLVQGLVATVAAVAPVEGSMPVLVFLNVAKRGLEQAELVHPQPVCMIQWRPWSLYSCDQSEIRREILMTCCFDGTVRLWSEDEEVRLKQQHVSRISFSVIAVIEVNSTLNGVLGVDISVRWSMESGSVVSRDEEGNFKLFSGNSRESQVGKCEWLVSVGPGPCVNFWAVHCLDDVFPPRYPRITLWKQSKLQGLGECYVNSGAPKSMEQSIFIEVVMSRRSHAGPPTTCSLLHLLLDNSFVWSELSTSMSADSGAHVSSDSAKSISCCLTKSVKQDGHEGSIRQVSVHPYSCEIELAVFMDSNGMIFFWSLSTFSTLKRTLHAPMYPLWNLLCKFDLRKTSKDLQYSCLCWAPSVSHENRFLVLGDESGADCFTVRIQKEEVLSCQKIFTIPFLGERNTEGPPDSIHTIPLASKCSRCFVSNSFLVVCLWRKSFQAFSWKVVLHSENQYVDGKCLCGFATSSLSTTNQGTHANCFSSEKFSAVVYEGSSVFPSSLEGEYPTCISVVQLNNTVLPIQQYDPYRTVPGYHIATGYSNGTVKLWKGSCADNSLQTEKGRHIWELVGMFGAHERPVSTVLLSTCGRIITASRNLKENSTSIHIWEAVKFRGDGSFLLEDALMLQDHIVGLDGLSLGDGRFLLAVYLANELRIYSHKHPSSHNVLHTENSKEEHLWRCIVLSHSHHDITGFLWGPKATVVLVHDNHLSLFSSWLVTGADECITQIPACPVMLEMSPCTESFNETTFDRLKLTENNNKSGTTGSNGMLLMDQHDSHYSHGLWDLLRISDKLSGVLASYHPRALVQYLYSGEWKRANAALQHLVQSMKVSETSKGMSKCISCRKSCHDIPELPLSEYFADTSNNISTKGFLWGEDRSNTSFNLLSPSTSVLYADDNLGVSTTSASQTSEIVELLDKNFSIYGISDSERTQILAISDLMDRISNQAHSSCPYKSLDEAGRRFWVAVQFQQLHALRRSGYSSSTEGCHVDSASIAWAFQSDCHDDLLNSVLPVEPTWPEMRKLGVGLWYTNVSQLRTKMEKLARLQYLKNKDPKDCALLYIALNRTKVLVGLFKISRDEKDKRLYEFLSRNFQEERHKAAALKNAYVLMGRHQWELAIAFFLLGDDTSSAVNVCAKNLQDEQLAIVICRLVEGSGGPLERNLISNVLLPGAAEKGDKWLSSLLEWMLGNYCRSINRLFGCHPELPIDESRTLGDQNVLADPEVGHYCVILSTKNSFRNSVGEAVSTKLSTLSFAVAAYALNKCGLPLEALECLCTISGIDGKGNISSPGDGDKIFDGILSPFSASKNWLSSSVVSDVESNLKVTMASKYLSSLLRKHIFCSRCNASLSEDNMFIEYKEQIEKLTHDVTAVILIFDKRFSLKFSDIAEQILIFCCHDGLLFLAYALLWGTRSPDVATDNSSLECCSSRPIDHLLLVSFKESCKFLGRHVVFCSFMCFFLNMELTNTTACAPKINNMYIIACLSNFLNASRLLLRSENRGNYILDNRSAMLAIMDLLEYVIEFSFSWLYRDIKALLILINPVLTASVNGEHFQALLDRLLHAVRHKNHDESSSTEGGMPSVALHYTELKKSDNSNLIVDEKWHLIGCSVWARLISVMEHYLRDFVEQEGLEHEAGASDSEFKCHITSVAAKFLMDSIRYVSSSLVKLHASFLRKNLLMNSHSSVLFWLECNLSQQHPESDSNDQLSKISQLPNSENMEVLFNTLWGISVNPVDICNTFINEGVTCFSLSSINVTRSWKDIKVAVVECENNITQISGEEHEHGVGSKNNAKGQGFTDKTSTNGEVFLETKRKELIVQKQFQSPTELLRRSGELLEAICLNSINEKQAAIATNRKGLVFFNWSDKQYDRKFADAEYVWSGSDWPSDGWAGCEPAPTPTFISTGAGPVRRKGLQLGSRGATIGLGSLAKPGRDLTGGGAFGIPGYAGIGASGFGWGEPEEFEDFVDPPATLENIHSRALSRHPSLPLFLVGSSNTHVYLWEFGKDSAMATYGVLPAANIPPPYALASISAVQFDYYGQRFATAALDGTICTWQVEVGGRSNVLPTESSICFDSHASDVTYVSASGSVVASAGYSSNGANIVIWDTLSPPATCHTSILCHEGGARSVSVFDSERGCGSISPLVVTGGKSGDVALHDFRFFSTGKSKHHRISPEHGVKASSTESSTSHGTTSGMVWHIPKAHLGTVTKVSAIPNTSLFLTGSKDGDVKLWDAKNYRLVCHWPKLHERHTFFQPTSRGFGGVVRAAVTDLQVLSHGFISCGGDGSVKLVQIKDDIAGHQC